MIGATLPPADLPRSTTGIVVQREFRVPPARPLRGGVPLADVMRQLEADPQMAEHLAAARRELATAFDQEAATLRALRLAAGLSQAKLAERAGTTQPFIARIEAGTVDPGTDMLARIADGIGVDATVVFNAIRAQRRPSEARAHG